MSMLADLIIPDASDGPELQQLYYLGICLVVGLAGVIAALGATDAPEGVSYTRRFWVMFAKVLILLVIIAFILKVVVEWEGSSG